MKHILVVEDEAVIRNALKRLLERHNYEVSEAGSVREASMFFPYDQFSLIISDLRLPGAPGTDLIKLAGDTPVLIMTSYASLRSAVDSMKKGAVDYIAKPFDHDEMLSAVKRIIKEKSPRQKKSADSSSHPAGMLGSCEAMQHVYDVIHKVAPTSTTVLIHGETGTGKEMVAQSIHQESRRAEKSMISVNCAAIPETLIESELFGYEKGAFTGAQSNRAGLIEAADGGTLFLDEIGELPLEAQARLLRFLQEGEIRAIGSVQSRKVDVRVIAATHRDLRKLSQQQKFREDLFYRINVMQITVPPLRERGKDILELAESLLTRNAGRLNKSGLRFSPRAIQAITTYTWPGNVRELENAVERAMILCDGEEIDSDLLDIDLEVVSIHQLRGGDGPMSSSEPVIRPARTIGNPRPEPAEDLSLEDYFQRFVLEHQDTMSETELAKKLGVSRKCLWERRQRLGIPRSKGGKRSKAL